MDTYNSNQIRKKVDDTLNANYERMYPFELERSLNSLGVQARDNGDEKTLQEIRWEFDLLNATFGHSAVYQGEQVSEISNKWAAILKNGKDINSGGKVSSFDVRSEAGGSNVSFQLFSNPPFCTWDKNALDYYKKRYSETTSSLSKARYAFAVAVLLKESGSKPNEWIEKSIASWVKTAEQYIASGQYNQQYYEVPPFAYEFAIKLSLMFSMGEAATSALNSLHAAIVKMINSGEKRWYLEYVEVESTYLNSAALKNESMSLITGVISDLESKFDSSSDKSQNLHFYRRNIQLLLDYGVKDDFEWNKKIAESYLKEADFREEQVKSAFYEDAIKHYKMMQSKYSADSVKKGEIDSKLETIALKIKDASAKFKYKQIASTFTITNDQIKQYIDFLKSKGGNTFLSLVDDWSLFPNIKQSEEMTQLIKSEHGLQFVLPVEVCCKDGPIIRYTTDDQIFEYKVRQNMLLGIRIGEIMLKMTFEQLEKENGIKLLSEINDILSCNDISDIRETLRCGFGYLFGEKKDYTAGLHILIPYLEELIRRIIVKSGKIDTVLSGKPKVFFRKIELGTLLTDDAVGTILNKDFQKTLHIYLVATDQANLRNMLLHGMMKSNEIKDSDALFVSYCLLKLIRILNELPVIPQVSSPVPSP